MKMSELRSILKLAKPEDDDREVIVACNSDSGSAIVFPVVDIQLGSIAVDSDNAFRYAQLCFEAEGYSMEKSAQTQESAPAASSDSSASQP